MAEDNGTTGAGQKQGAGVPLPQPPQGAGMPPPPPPGYNPYAPQGAGMPPPPPPGYNPYAPQGAGVPFPPPTQTPPKPIVPIGHFGVQGDFVTSIQLPPHKLKIDENKFLRLLAGSVSLMKDEKKRIIQAIARLTQEQVDELSRILEEEKEKFSELDQQHGDQLGTLETKHAQEWAELEIEMSAGERAEAETNQADAIRAQLGSGGTSGKKDS